LYPCLNGDQGNDKYMVSGNSGHVQIYDSDRWGSIWFKDQQLAGVAVAKTGTNNEYELKVGETSYTLTKTPNPKQKDATLRITWGDTDNSITIPNFLSGQFSLFMGKITYSNPQNFKSFILSMSSNKIIYNLASKMDSQFQHTSLFLYQYNWQGEPLKQTEIPISCPPLSSTNFVLPLEVYEQDKQQHIWYVHDCAGSSVSELRVFHNNQVELTCQNSMFCFEADNFKFKAWCCDDYLHHDPIMTSMKYQLGTDYTLVTRNYNATEKVGGDAYLVNNKQQHIANLTLSDCPGPYFYWPGALLDDDNLVILTACSKGYYSLYLETADLVHAHQLDKINNLATDNSHLLIKQEKQNKIVTPISSQISNDSQVIMQEPLTSSASSMYSGGFIETAIGYTEGLVSYWFNAKPAPSDNPQALMIHPAFSLADEPLEDLFAEDTQKAPFSNQSLPTRVPGVSSYVQQAYGHFALLQVAYEMGKELYGWCTGTTQREQAVQQAQAEQQGLEELKQYGHNPYAKVYLETLYQLDIGLGATEDFAKAIASLAHTEERVLIRLVALALLAEPKATQALAELPESLQAVLWSWSEEAYQAISRWPDANIYFAKANHLLQKEKSFGQGVKSQEMLGTSSFGLFKTQAKKTLILEAKPSVLRLFKPEDSKPFLTMNHIPLALNSTCELS
jgi:hypothetical protein